MSLLITRNNANGSPESYHNHLRDTFEVAPMSEIAVHTCIINRDPTYVVKGECDIYVYHGGYLSDADVTLNEVGYEAYMQFYGVAALWVDQPIVIHLKDGDYSLRDFAQEVQTALNTYDFHPSFQGKWTCTFDDVRAADGSFNGFKIENIQRGLDAPSSETGVTKVLNGGLTLNAATQRLTRGTSATYPQPRPEERQPEPAPELSVEPIAKPKRQASAKQREHLARIRVKAAESRRQKTAQRQQRPATARSTPHPTFSEGDVDRLLDRYKERRKAKKVAAPPAVTKPERNVDLLSVPAAASFTQAVPDDPWAECFL
jgi:hypothetical protein